MCVAEKHASSLFAAMFLSSPYVSVADDARFKHFVKRILPRLRENPQPGALVFVRSYFDFVRVRNLLTSEDVSFAVVSEYTPPKDAARARSIFADGRKRVLLVTERAHFYFRRRVRGRGRGFSFCGRFFFSLFFLCFRSVNCFFLEVFFGCNVYLHGAALEVSSRLVSHDSLHCGPVWEGCGDEKRFFEAHLKSQ